MIIDNDPVAEIIRLKLMAIGETVNVWPLPGGESTRALSHRISVALAEAIADREAMLDIVLSLSRSPTCNAKE